ncbi:Y-family DNA polymerase [Mucilaginibacter ginsenosidivorax]|uniref:DNA polymerase Y family protein n=1 Tax=Mucilaginibacter ginsenosidivorax TaxID=862126 RepID=A0A5B8VUA3_9SPHI|nr:DNA polymerase Y family protein [Mucilaginibacter ginsenosidivorax]QEC74711.1 DNA polymerase Y family protein [Mucilaginibacter ginsenosidivorax]
MPKRFASLWFRHLLTDWKAIRQPGLKGKAYVFAEPDHGRMLITALTDEARKYGVIEGMTVADARVIAPDLQVFDGKTGRNTKLLTGLAEWCLRYTPLVQLDPPDGLLLDVTGCTHLKGGEKAYLQDITNRLKILGYDVRPAIADTIGAAWGVARCGTDKMIIPEGEHRTALMPLPPAALRLPSDQLLKLRNLGLHQISSFIYMPDSVLRRRFGKNMILRLNQARGLEVEYLFPLKEPVPYTERLECLEAIKTRPTIEIALHNLLERLCKRLYGEGLGLRSATLTWYRVDGKNGHITIGTNHASNRVQHLFKLFFIHLDNVAPGLGIELFTLDAGQTEPVSDKQSELWSAKGTLGSEEVAELLDRVAVRIGTKHINRYLPGEHYWPERTPEANTNLKKKPESDWRTDKPRPMQLLDKPERITAMALTPDYPPKQFSWQGRLHVIVAADGPERIEREWWLEPGEHRDYYIAEDEDGKRYWLFRSGHYNAENNQHWYLHGFFA